MHLVRKEGRDKNMEGKKKKHLEWIRKHSKRIKQIVRWLVIFVLVTFGAISLLFPHVMSWIEVLDTGGFASLLVAIAFSLGLKIDESVWEQLHELKDNMWRVIILILALAGFFGVWLTLRVLGLYFTLYLSGATPSYHYLASNIFSFISYALASNLCFSLVRTFSAIGRKELKEPKRINDLVPELLDTLLQAVLIGVLVFIPRFDDTTLLLAVGGIDHYLLILITLIATIVVLVYTRKRVRNVPNLSRSYQT
jgi:hypothetical protein